MIDDEARRVEAVRNLGLLDTEPEERFDRIAELARELFDVPMVGINLIDADRQFSKASIGLEREIPRSDAFCSATIEGYGQLLVQDAARDGRFSHSPLVTGDPHIRFYAGQPLSADGQTVGALCIIDDKPRELTTSESRLLRHLGRLVENELALDKEAVQAREVQRRLLPRRTPDVEGLQVAGRCLPARAVGGDFFDWQELDGRLQVMLADVMGKGITAAVIAAGVRAVMRGTSRYNGVATSVARTATSMHEDLEESGTFVTMFGVRIDPGTGEIEYVDAGHGLAVVLHPDGTARQLSTSGLPLGALEDDTWEAHTDRLEPGETLLLVSDGVIDAFPDLPAAIAGAERLARANPEVGDLVDEVIELFTDAIQPDDVTVVAVRRTPC